eukprot:778001-Pyramimonas_sp.AAC.2
MGGLHFARASRYILPDILTSQPSRMPSGCPIFFIFDTSVRVAPSAARHPSVSRCALAIWHACKRQESRRVPRTGGGAGFP